MRGDVLGLLRGGGSDMSFFTGNDLGLVAFTFVGASASALDDRLVSGGSEIGSVLSVELSDRMDFSIMSRRCSVSSSMTSLSGLRLASLPKMTCISAFPCDVLGHGSVTARRSRWVEGLFILGSDSASIGIDRAAADVDGIA